MGVNLTAIALPEVSRTSPIPDTDSAKDMDGVFVMREAIAVQSEESGKQTRSGRDVTCPQNQNTTW